MRLWLTGIVLVLQLLLATRLEAAAEQPQGAIVQLGGETILVVQSAAGAQSPERLARHLSNEITSLAEDYSFDPTRISTKADPPYVMVGIREEDGGFKPLLAIDERAASLAKTSQSALAKRDAQAIQTGIKRYRIQRTPGAWLRGTAIALLVLLGYVLLIQLERRLNQRATTWLGGRASRRFPDISLAGNRLISRGHIQRSLQLGRGALHWAALAAISYLMVPLLLSFFPPTMGLAADLREQMLLALQQLWGGVLNVVPNLIALVLLGAIVITLLKLNRRVFRALESETIRFDWFYPEWALPTARITTILIVAGGLALALPYIPGSTSRAFQGAGVFLGILAALGSSAIATNILSGLMLIYTRGFREGDRVAINSIVGTVQERALLVTRILTPLNELVSIPNAMVIANPVTNYSLASRELGQPVAVNACITIGYEVPWRQVHTLLLEAAATVDGICQEPAPNVVQTSLNDWHVSYELDARIHDANQYRAILSRLLAAIQDSFATAGIEILSPAYEVQRDSNGLTIPPRGSSAR
ncbi:mechanosensitive ion channel family protein [Synechococcus sp. HK05]|uniref:mechanosensitive ion channel family protein n=1 Tax=Synechococcus sp. HK05 TaxID=2725975 RepID=UPI0020CB2872|nr:mechanosensitive ion channel domain-containing protein [Synechococcus sp. HK05]